MNGAQQEHRCPLKTHAKTSFRYEITAVCRSDLSLRASKSLSSKVTKTATNLRTNLSHVGGMVGFRPLAWHRFIKTWAHCSSTATQFLILLTAELRENKVTLCHLHSCCKGLSGFANGVRGELCAKGWQLFSFIVLKSFSFHSLFLRASKLLG